MSWSLCWRFTPIVRIGDHDSICRTKIVVKVTTDLRRVFPDNERTVIGPSIDLDAKNLKKSFRLAIYCARCQVIIAFIKLV